MRGRSVLACTFALAGVALAACGGGGTSPVTTPRASATAAATLAPSAANRTAIGTSKLVLVFPKTVTGKSGKALRAVPAAANRSPQYINPSPAPSSQIYAGNVLDIYVDGTLVPNIDGSEPTMQHSLVLVSPATDGTQTVTLPIYSTNHDSVVVVERDYNGSASLAIGDAEASGQISPGGSVNLTLTMQMNAVSIGLVQFPGLNGAALLDGSNYLGYTCPNVGQQFGLFTADAEGVLVPVSGYGGTGNAPVATFAHPGGGTTKVASSVIGGLYNLVWDGGCNGVEVDATVQNPANAIYSDVTSNYTNYYNAYFGLASYPAGPNQGIFNLYYTNDSNTVKLGSFASPTVSNSIVIVNGG
jgi:hypothetical protein